MILIKENLGKFFRWSIRRLEKWDYEKRPEDESPQFRSLAPKKDKISEVYMNALDFAFKDPSIYNIAVTGPYGSGKSSVLESYFAQREEHKRLGISLAQEENSENKEPAIDEKILNQIIHQISPSHTSASSFYRRENVRWWKLLGLASCWWLAILAILYLLNFRWLLAFSNSVVDDSGWLPTTLSFVTSGTFRVGVIIVFAICLFGVLIWIIRLQITQRVIKRLGFNDVSVDFFPDDNSSIFDRYLGEVIYLLRSSGATAIIFEDLDRFRDSSVFVRLREINSVLNKSNKGNPIHFIYVLRDDMFSVKDRTKYFDFIIPIVPVADNSNAYEHMINMLSVGGKLPNLDEVFVSDVSLYIDEMRTITNIVNEYEVYDSVVQPLNQCKNKMFAIVVYKNLFPDDFALMQYGEGFVPYALSSLVEKIKQAENERLDEEIELLIKAGASDEGDEDSAKTKLDAQLRLLRLEQKEIENSDCFSDIVAVSKSETVSDILDANEDFTIFISAKNFPLAWYLLKNGYINEQYAEYASHFYEHSLKRSDKEYLRASVDGRSLGYDFALKDPEKIFKRRPQVIFQPTSLNFDLFAFLLSSGTQHEMELANQFRIIEHDQIGFLCEFWSTGINRIYFLQQLLDRERASFGKDSVLLEVLEYSQETLLEIVTSALYSLDFSMIAILQKRQKIIDLIEGDEFVIPGNLTKGGQDTLFTNIRLLAVEFSNISSAAPEGIAKYWVYENSAYKLNLVNLTTIAYDILHPPMSEDDFNHRNFTSLISRGETSLLKKIESEMSNYIKCLIDLGVAIRDSEEVALRVLNDSSIDLELRQGYLTLLKTGITSLSSIDDTALQGLAVAQGKIDANEENVLQHFHKEQHLTDGLVIMMNSASPPLDFSSIDFKAYHQDFKANFFRAVIKCNKLDDVRYIDILKSLKMHYKDFSFEEIDEGKVNLLIKARIIRFSKAVLVFLRGHFPSSVLQLVLQNIHPYTSLLKREPSLLAMVEVRGLLNSKTNYQNKLNLLGVISEPISLKGLNVSPSVKRYIIENNFDEEDFQFVLKGFSAEPNSIKRAIVEQMTYTHAIAYLRNEKIYIPSEALSMLVQYGGIRQDDSLHLLAIAVKGYSFSELVKVLNLMSESGFVEALSGYRPRIELSSGGLALAEVLRCKGWISSYKQIAGSGMYRVIGRRSSNLPRV